LNPEFLDFQLLRIVEQSFYFQLMPSNKYFPNKVFNTLHPKKLLSKVYFKVVIK
jgi:hypothetical protein